MWITDFTASLLASLMMHPFHVGEARYILNNRLPNFNSYKSSYTFLTNIGMDFLNGITVHLPRSFILSLTGFNYWSAANIYSYLATQLTF